MATGLSVNWRTVLAEGLAVLGGVLAAFAIDAWWDGRQDSRQRDQYIEALRVELVDTRREVVGHLDRMTASMEAARDLLSLVAAPSSATASADSVTTLLGLLGPLVDFAPRRAAFDDLINSGGLQLIESDSLRRALAAYERAWAEDLGAQEEFDEFWRIENSPFNNAHANLGAIAPEGRVADDISVADLRFEMDRDAFLGRTYANLLMHRLFLSERIRQRHHVVLDRIDSILELIAQS